VRGGIRRRFERGEHKVVARLEAQHGGRALRILRAIQALQGPVAASQGEFRERTFIRGAELYGSLQTKLRFRPVEGI
jgi:hypothetical protein